jgi:hypothetical protein
MPFVTVDAHIVALFKAAMRWSAGAATLGILAAVAIYCARHDLAGMALVGAGVALLRARTLMNRAHRLWHGGQI